MKEGKGKISRIFQNETKGGKPYWVVAVQTDVDKYERFSCWTYKLLEGISEKDTITFKYEQKGKYNNITEISKAERSSSGLGEMLEYHSGSSIEQIGRMSALKSATQLMVDYKGEPDEKIRKTLDAARELEKYIFYGSGTSEEQSPTQKG